MITEVHVSGVDNRQKKSRERICFMDVRRTMNPSLRLLLIVWHLSQPNGVGLKVSAIHSLSTAHLSDTVRSRNINNTFLKDLKDVFGSDKIEQGLD